MMNHIIKIIVALSLIEFVKAQCDYSSSNGDYKAMWYVDKDSPTMVHFKIMAKQKAANGYWTGIGFGSGMTGGDFVIVNTLGDSVSVTDRHGVGFTEPVVDTQQNIRVAKASVENGIIKAEFTRAIDTGDPEDSPLKDPNNKNCQNFIFPESGGTATSIQTIRKHSSTPMTKLICNIDSCTSGGGKVDTNANTNPTASETPRPETPTDSAAGPDEKRRPFGLPPRTTGNQDGNDQVPQLPPRSSANNRRPESTSNTGSDVLPQQPDGGTLPNRRPTLVNSETGPNTAPNNTPLGPAESGAPTNPLVQPVVPTAGSQGQQTSCPSRADHRACKKYVDNYLEMVFASFERNFNNFQRACNLLIAQQQGLVRRECCNYLSQAEICRQFLNNI